MAYISDAVIEEYEDMRYKILQRLTIIYEFKSNIAFDNVFFNNF